jgi:hypothetical protein
VCVQELIKQRFDPAKFAGVFTRGGGGPPKWLDGLAADRSAIPSYPNIVLSRLYKVFVTIG